MRVLVLVLGLLLPQLCFGGENYKIRVLALKHSKEQMAQGDEDLAFRSIQEAKAKGLDIKAIGGHWVDRNGIMRVVIRDFEYNIPEFKKFVSQEMKIDAQQGDTLIVFTIGHGFHDGNLQNLGQRSDVLKAIAEAAQENNQRVLWWQLSCYAAAKLPDPSTLPEGQRELISILASSSARQQSPAYVEGKVMGKVFNALAEDSRELDSDGDEEISAEEFKKFMGRSDIRRGELVFSNTSSQVVFGGTDLANQIPIVDRNNPQGKYPPGYIPVPTKKFK